MPKDMPVLSGITKALSLLLALDDKNSKPLIAFCRGDRYAPYPDFTKIRDRGASSPQWYERQLQEQSTAIDALVAARPDLSLLDYSSLPLHKIESTFQESDASHVLFFFGPGEWDLIEGTIPGTKIEAYNLLRPRDQKVLDSVATLDPRYLNYVGTQISFIVWCLALRSFPASRQVSLITNNLHSSREPDWGMDGLLRPLRLAAARQTSAIDVVRFHVHQSEGAELIRNAETPAIVRAFTGTGPATFRFVRLDTFANWFANLDKAAAEGFFGGINDARRAESALWLPDSEIEAEWEPEFHSLERRKTEGDFLSVGEWVAFEDLTHGLANEEENCFSNEELGIGVRVPVLEIDDWDKMVEGRWGGAFSGATTYVGQEGVEEFLLKKDDILVPCTPWGVGLQGNLHIVREEEAGAVPSWELLAYRILPKWNFARDWVVAFLRSDAGAAWLAMSEPTADFPNYQRLERWLLPVPNRSMALAFARSLELEERLRSSLSDLKAKRESVMRVGPEGPRLHSLPSLVSEVRALDQAVADLGSLQSKIRALYPTFLASGYRDYITASLLDPEIESGLRLVENCAAYLVVLSAVQLEADGMLAGSEFLRMMKSGLKAGLTFGSWIKLFEASANHPSMTPLGETLALVRSDPGVSASFETAKALRNDRAHHRLSRPDADRKRVELRQTVEAVFEALEPLTQYELVMVEEAHNDPRMNLCRSYRARVLAGDHPNGRKEAGSAPIRLESRSLYIRPAEDVWLVTSPFVVHRESTNSRIVELGVMDRWDSTTNRLLFRGFTDPDHFVDEIASQHFRQFEE
jgi:hypothetical protein